MTQPQQQAEGFWAVIGADEPEPPWSLTDIAITGGVFALAMIVIASTVALLVAGDVESLPNTQQSLIGWGVGLALISAFILVRWRRDPQRFAALRLTGERFSLYVMLLIGVAVLFTVDLIAAAFSSFSAHPALVGLESGIGNSVIALVVVGLVQPIADGLLFFGVILPRLRATLGAWAGILTTTLLFTLYYALVYGARLSSELQLAYGVIFPLLIGLALCLVRVWAQSTRAAIVTYIGIGVSAVLAFIALG